MCLSVDLWDRVEPRVLGVPFNMAWMLAWIALSPALMGIAYWIEKRR